MDQNALLLEQAARIRESQILGRSRLIKRLFDFLVDCGVAGRVPKEIDVAIDAFERDDRFDPSLDAVVRVCVHKLRRKLEEFYSGPGSQEPARITVARGEYRLIVERVRTMPAIMTDTSEAGSEQTIPARPRRALSPTWIAAGLILSVAANLFLWVGSHSATEAAAAGLDKVRNSGIWAPLLDDDLPIYIVVGDYYIFGEMDEHRRIQRLVRDFKINSREDLEWSIKNQPATSGRYRDVDLDYLPTASAYALGEIMPVLAAANRRIRVTVSSELDPAALKSAHVIYIGFLSGLGMLREPVFSGSRFLQGETFDELIDKSTGLQYVSEVGGPVQGQLRYRDYGYISTFPGPAGNQFIIIAGTRDTAVMQTAEMMTDARRIDEVRTTVGNRKAAEALYEVYGFDNTNIDARLVLAANLNTTGIWTEKSASAVQNPAP